MLFEEFVRPHFRVTVLPIHASLSVLRGVQVWSPMMKVCGMQTVSSQGVMPSCIASV